jgi:tartrate-resistant acid phosphatase type 5
LDDKSVRFFVLGDWGGAKKAPFTTPGQLECAGLIGSMGLDKKPQFFVSTGDNFYEYGVKDAQDPRFKVTFDDVFQYGKDAKLPWYVTLGNHDWYGNGSAQVEYTKLNDRWVCPDFSFTTSYDARPAGPSVDVVFLDTIVLCGNTWNSTADDSDPKGEEAMGIHGAKMKEYLGPADPKQAERMWQYAEQQMANSKADYLFVVGHYPAFASDRHSVSDCLVPKLQDLLDKYDGNGYICGHAHNMQHTTTVGKSGRVIHHVLSGAGHLTNANYKPALEELAQNPWQAVNKFFFPQKQKHQPKQSESMGGLTYVELGPKKGTFEYRNCDGTLLYSFDVKARTA